MEFFKTKASANQKNAINGNYRIINIYNKISKTKNFDTNKNEQPKKIAHFNSYYSLDTRFGIFRPNLSP